MQLRVSNPDGSMDYKRRSVTRGLFSENQNEVTGWMKALKSLDGPEMPFDKMCDIIDGGETMLHATKNKREKKFRRCRHFSLRRNPTLLTKTEEIELGRKVQELLRWEHVRKLLELRLGRPATLEEWAVEVAAMDGVEGLMREIDVMKAARERMISRNLRLVLHVARKRFFSGRAGALKVSLEDMIQDGTNGLIKAVERFDPEKGFRFSTYATWWVHQGIHRGFADCGRVIRLPLHMHTMVCKVARLQAALVDQHGKEPTLKELSRECGLKEWQVKKCLLADTVEPISMDLHHRKGSSHIVSDNSSKRERIGDGVMSTNEQEPVDGADVSLLKTDVATILGDLSEREACVLRMRFGLCGSTPSTLETVGLQLHLTRERVRQIQVAAMQKLRGWSPTHEVLYSDRKVSAERLEKAHASATAKHHATAKAKSNAKSKAARPERDGHPGGLRSEVMPLIDTMTRALEPWQDEILMEKDGRVTTPARRRLTIEAEAARAERARSLAPNKNGSNKRSRKGSSRDFVGKRQQTHTPRAQFGVGVNGDGAMGEGSMVSSTSSNQTGTPSPSQPLWRRYRRGDHRCRRRSGTIFQGMHGYMLMKCTDCSI